MVLTSFQKLTSIGYSLAVIGNATSWLLLWWLVPQQAPSTILHYNVFFGPDAFGSWYQLFVLPAIGLAVMLLNGYGTWWLWRIDRFLSYSLTSGAVAVQVVVLIAVILLIRVNTL